MIFIRPFLLLLLLVPFLFKISKSRGSTKTPWTKWVDATLLPALLVGDRQNHSFGLWRKSLILLWSLFVIASAGPAFDKLPVPVGTSLPNTVLIFDLGPAMQGATLANAKIKLNDLLTALKGNRVGLVLYADKGYTAVPLTQDRALIRALIPTLDPSVLPNPQQNPAAAFHYADTLIQQSGGNGRILYITAGGVDGRNIKSAYPIGVLGLDDKAVSATLKQLGAYQAKSADASDILSLLKATEPDTSIQFDMDETADEWADLAGILTLILLPFFAFTFKKGFLFGLLFFFIIPVQAAFFLRPDQQAYYHHQEAVEHYRKGVYDKAIQGFENHPYNQGNALAHAGKIQEAIQAYTKELKINPDNEDARFNKEYLEKQLPPPEQQNQQSEQQKSDKDNPDQQADSQNQDDQQSNEENQNSQKNDSQQQQQDSSQQQENQANASQPTEPQDTEEQIQQQEVDESSREKSPFNQEEQQVLNRLNTDPYRVLRYRLQQQARKK